MQGLWIAVTTSDHPVSYDPAVGKVTGQERWQVGAIVDCFEGNDEPMPEAGSERVGGKQYRWLFYAGMTKAQLHAFLAMGIDRDDPFAFRGNLRVADYASGMAKRPGSQLAVDISTAIGPRTR